MTTAELDAIARREFARAGARSGPQLDYGFPGTTCISVNDEAVHGIPGRRRLRRGDLVKLDVTAELDGFYADACRTVAVGDARPRALKLVRASEQALDAALKVVRSGVALNEIGATVSAPGPRARLLSLRRAYGPRDRAAHPRGARRAQRLRSRALRAAARRARHHDRAARRGRRPEVRMHRDGWTVSTLDGSLSAHSEHTIVVRAGAPLVLTA